MLGRNRTTSLLLPLFIVLGAACGQAAQDDGSGSAAAGAYVVTNGSIKIAAGSTASVSGFEADQYYAGGSTYSNSSTVDVSQIVADPPPASLFNRERYGAMTYTIPGFVAGNTYAVTLYFAETYLSASGQRTFGVSINGTQVISRFDIYAAAGGQNRAIARTFQTTASASGQIVIQLTAETQNPKVNGIAIAPVGNGTVYPLTVTASGAGTVSSSPAGIRCGETCTATFASGTAVTLSAVASASSTFTGWGGACTGAGTCVVTMTAARDVTATFSGGGTSTVSINAGGAATGDFVADQYYANGSTYANANAIDLSLLGSSPAPAAIFGSERYGAMTYTIPNRSGPQTVTLFFAETYVTGIGQRTFNVAINGSTVLSGFDIYAAAGGQNRAVARTFSTTANPSGQIVIQFTAGTQNPKINGIQVTGAAGGSSYQRGPDPTGASVSATRGPFATAQLTVPAGSGFNGGYIYYPTDTSLGTWAGVAIVPGYSALFSNEEAWMGPWLASFGFVVIGIETNSRTDGADARATQLLAALDYLTQQSSVRSRVDPARLMVMGHSAGGAGALTAALRRPSLRTVVGLAPGAPGGGLSLSNLHMPTMIIGGQNDATVTPSYLNGLWVSLPSSTQRAWVELAGNDHLSFTRSNPTEMRVLIPWMKIFLDGDARYLQFLCPLSNSSGISNYRNTCPFVP